MRYIAPVGTPISLHDFRESLYYIFKTGNILEKFKQAICGKYKVKHSFFLSSGRAALYILLRSFKELSASDRDEVIIPSYNCLSVPEAIAKAGLKIRICDIDANTLDYDFKKLSKLDFTKALCIISANLYGIPNNLARLSEIAGEHDIFLIDDAAQCMGGKTDGKFLGTFGDAGIYSLGKGKNITSMYGGIIVTDSDSLASLIESKLAVLPGLTVLKKISYVLQLILYSILLRPGLCWIPANLPFLDLEGSSYDSAFPVESYDKVLGSMGFQLFQKLNELTEIRIDNARYLLKALTNFQVIKHIQHNEFADPVYLRLPVLISDTNIRTAIIERLRKKGIDAAVPYPSAIADVPEIESIIVNSDDNFTGGRLVAEQLVTLPTHPHVNKNDLDIIISIITEALNMT